VLGVVRMAWQVLPFAQRVTIFNRLLQSDKAAAQGPG
jgi:hypothetical protein